MKKILLLDGFNLTFRAFYALPEFTNKEGIPTNALHGWLRTIWKIQDEEGPCDTAAFFDSGGSHKREQLLESYKENREEAPDALKTQIPYIQEMTAYMGISVHKEDGIEADDLIACAVEQLRDTYDEILIVSADKDLAQLISPGVNQLLPPPTAKPSLGWRKLDREGVEEKFGVTPEQIPDYLALIGDTSDNIPGIQGVGPKTATNWLRRYKNLDGIQDNCARLNPKRFQTVIYQSKELLKNYLELTTLETHHPLDPTPGQTSPDLNALCELLTKMDMNNSVTAAQKRYG